MSAFSLKHSLVSLIIFRAYQLYDFPGNILMSVIMCMLIMTI